MLLPLIIATVFVAGCLMIQSLRRWADRVTDVLDYIFVAVLLMLAGAILAMHPDTMPAAVAQPTLSAAIISDGESLTFRTEPEGIQLPR